MHHFLPDWIDTRLLLVIVAGLILVAAPLARSSQQVSSLQGDQDENQAATQQTDNPDNKTQESVQDENAEEEAAGTDDADGDEADGGDDEDDPENGDEEDADEEDPNEEDNTITINGYFSAEKVAEISLITKQWSSFTVVEFVEHGTEVRKGDTLIKFDTVGIDQSIADLESEIATGEIDLNLAEHKLKLLKKTTPVRLEKLERDERIATENLKQFLAVNRAQTRKSLDRSVKTAEDRLMYEQEELDQLEKMYNADDLTEETEEIILLRTRNAVESAEYYLDRTRESHDESLKLELPRREELLEDELRNAGLALEEARVTLPVRLETEDLALDKSRMEHQRRIEKLAKLTSDREMMEIEAPISGTVYYGRVKNGKWTNPSTMQTVFRTGGTAKRNQTLLSVVKIAPLNISASLKEAQLHHLRVSSTGAVTPTAFPDTEFSATIVNISMIPAGETFPATLEMEGVPDEVTLVPGMTCDINFEKPSDDDEAGEDAENEEEDENK